MPIPLQPGISAPDFLLPAAQPARSVSLVEHRGKRVMLFFFPFPCGEELAAQLVRYQERVQGFAEQAALVIGVSDAPEDSLRRLAGERGVQFMLLSDSRPAGGTAGRYGARSEAGAVLPFLFLVDEEGLIRRVYEPSSGAGLPNPAMVGRALNKLADTPKPAPVAEDDWRLGPREAGVVLIEYSDYQCGRCAELHDLLGQILPGYGRKVQLVHRHYLLRHSHPRRRPPPRRRRRPAHKGSFGRCTIAFSATSRIWNGRTSCDVPRRSGWR